MKRTLLLAVAAFATISVASAQNLKATINKMNQAVCRALKNRDMALFEKITRPSVTSDFKHVEMGHSMTYDEMLAQMKQSFAMLKKVNSATAKTNKISIHGDTATSESTHHIVAVMAGPDKKNHKMVMNGLTKDVYRKEGKQWKLAEMDWVNQKMTMDGKPFNPGQ